MQPAESAAPNLDAPPEPLEFTIDPVEPLKGSPTGTEAFLLRRGPAHLRIQLTQGPSQVSEHFHYAHGSFCREPASDTAQLLADLTSAWSSQPAVNPSRVSIRAFDILAMEPTPPVIVMRLQFGAPLTLEWNQDTRQAVLTVANREDGAKVLAELVEVL
jgi:hypothetical protein